MQPMDGGIIKAFKSHYKRLLVRFFIILFEEEENSESASQIPTKEEAYRHLEFFVKCIESSSTFSGKDIKIINVILERLVDIN